MVSIYPVALERAVSLLFLLQRARTANIRSLDSNAPYTGVPTVQFAATLHEATYTFQTISKSHNSSWIVMIISNHHLVLGRYPVNPVACHGL